MPVPQKGFKAINHRDVQYRWIMQNKRGVNELIVVATAPVDGQRIIAELTRVVSYSRVTEAIDFANDNGWTPNESAPPMLLKFSRGKFHIQEPQA